jgi:hypothetical protein
LTSEKKDATVCVPGGTKELSVRERDAGPVQNRIDEEKVIPWAEGNGLWQTISKLTGDLASIDLLTFFVQNPYACDTAQSLSVRIGRLPEPIEPMLNALVEAELLIETRLGDQIVYSLTSDPHRRQTLQQYVSWLREGYHWTRMVMVP